MITTGGLTMQSMIELYFTRVREVAVAQAGAGHERGIAQIPVHDDASESEQPRAA